MAALSWRKWADPIIDFGGQLYIPWQISTGSVLYRDVMYLPGPASQYYHALLFKLFGVSFTAIIVSNLVILAAFVVLVYRLFLGCSDRLTAGAMAASVVLGFGFSQYIDVGNYNYMSPYSHEIWHGIVLGLVLLGCIVRWSKTSTIKWMLLGGLCFGAIFLMKPENFVAAAGLVVIAIVLTWKKPSSFKHWLLFLVNSLVPLVAMFFVFFAHEDARSSWLCVCGGWVPLVTTTMAGGTFFKTGMGMDAPWFHVRMMVTHFVILSGVVAICAWRFRTNQNRIERVVLFCVLAGLCLNFDWTHCGRSLPLILLSVLGLIAFRWLRFSEEDRAALFLPLLWMIFSLLLLLKMGVYPRIFHYGIFLAMPAFIAAVYCVLWLLLKMFPTSIDAVRFRPVVAVLISVGLARLVVQSALFYKDKDFAIGQGGDRMITYNPNVSPAGQGVQQAVEWLKANVASDATVAVLPEGAMINYLSRHRNPTPYIVFMSEIYAFGEERMMAPYRAAPPDYLLLVHRETAEYGLKLFGQQKGYGLDAMQWISTNYEPVQLIGAEPLKTGEFGIKIFRRKP